MCPREGFKRPQCHPAQDRVTGVKACCRDMALPVGGGPTGGWSSLRGDVQCPHRQPRYLGIGDVDIECHLSGGEGPSASV